MTAPSDLAWLAEQFEQLTDTIADVRPSEWAESNRYLPASVTPMPGFYSYEVAPYLREIVDCLDMRSPVREVSIMKGAQIGATVGVLENAIGYCIAHVPSAPIMMLTADAELARLRMESYITPMIQQSGLADRIASTDEISKRKSGKTDKKVSWIGGGSLLPFGAINANKLRSFSIQYLLEDEIDGYPEKVGKDGDPIELAEARTRAYTQTRKILRLSTPTLAGSSKIERAYADGDQRHYLVPCKSCGEYQRLRFQGNDKETGAVFGLVWDMDGERVRPDSVRYLCRFCQHPHVNSDKAVMLAAGRWEPTATPKHPTIRSYHLSALYSPARMYSWEALVTSWCDAWDVHQNRPKDRERLQVFYNNNLGEPFEERGRKLTLATVSPHRRIAYQFKQIPNDYARTHATGPVQVVTCAVDVHAGNLRVATFGWAPGERAFLIENLRFDGDTSRADDPNTWGKLRTLIEGPGYIATDGRRYPVSLTLVDAGYQSGVVIPFCAEYESGIFPIVGRAAPAKNQLMAEFAPYKTQLGTRGYRVTVDYYKSKLHSALLQKWDGQGTMPRGQFNAPAQIDDAALRELTAEYRRPQIDKATGRAAGFEWHRPSGAANELWDLLIYNRAAVDLLAWDVCVIQNEQAAADMDSFWQYTEQCAMFWRPG